MVQYESRMRSSACSHAGVWTWVSCLGLATLVETGFGPRPPLGQINNGSARAASTAALSRRCQSGNQVPLGDCCRRGGVSVLLSQAHPPLPVRAHLVGRPLQGVPPSPGVVCVRGRHLQMLGGQVRAERGQERARAQSTWVDGSIDGKWIRSDTLLRAPITTRAFWTVLGITRDTR